MATFTKPPPEPKPEAAVSIRFFPNDVKVTVEGFEKLSPRRIQRSIYMVYKEWNRQRKEYLNKMRTGGVNAAS